MQKVFLLSSRLGLLHLPQGQTEPNVGVEDGPQAVMTTELAAELGAEVSTFTYSAPDELEPTLYYTVYAQETTEAAKQIAAQIGYRNTSLSSVVIGGDHSVSLAHLRAILQTSANPQKTGIVMMDSHGDINLRATSPTGNIHGMWLRPVVDEFDVPELNQLIPQKLSPQHLMYIGNLDLDPAEQDFIAEMQIPVISVADVQQQFQRTQHFVKEWVKRFEHIHISIDIDGFDRSVAPATGIPCAAGFFPSDILPLVSILQIAPSWSVDLVEVNPRKTGAAQTITLAQEVLRSIVGTSSVGA